MTMRPDDRIAIDPTISRRDWAANGRWPCCGAPYPGVHGTCRVNVTEIMTPDEFLAKWDGTPGYPPNLVRLADKRPAVFYELMIEHRWNGEINIWTKGIADDYKSIRAIAAALRQIADAWDTENPEPDNAS